jgi:1,4-dihydroxy-2-naphthoate octaprenyltransferase
MNRSDIKNIIILGRLHFVAGGFMLFCIGAFFALISGAGFSFQRFLFGYAILFCAHLSVSYSNDYFDRDSDMYNSPTMFTGGSGILVGSPELKIFAKKFAIILILLSLILAFVFTFFYSYPLYFLGFVVFGNLLGWFYTAPPVRLVYRRMGEIATVLTAGIMLPGMGYLVMNGTFGWNFLILAMPLMMYGIAFILGVEIPDMEGDIRGNKRTMIVRNGRPFGFTVIAICFFLATLYFVIMAMFYNSVIPFRFEWLALLSLIPTGMGLAGLIKRPVETLVASKFANNEVAALFLFVFLVDIYFLSILI